jgi:hypothetical protein
MYTRGNSCRSIKDVIIDQIESNYTSLFFQYLIIILIEKKSVDFKLSFCIMNVSSIFNVFEPPSINNILYSTRLSDILAT